MELKKIVFLTFSACALSGHKEEPFRYAIGSNKRYEAYDYTSIDEKLTESLEKSCREHVSINISNPPMALTTFWKNVPPPMTLIDKEICLESQKFFDRKGCSKGVALHPDSPRCHREKIKESCDSLVSEFPKALDETIFSRSIGKDQILSTAPFIITAKDGIISRCGSVALPCGVLHTQTGCGAIRDEEARVMFQDCSNNTMHKCKEIPKFKKVFVLSYKYDSAIGHFLTEVLPRVIYHIDILKEEGMYIHYGCDKKYKRFSPPVQFLEVMIMFHVGIFVMRYPAANFYSTSVVRV